jgi:hypothetical protein
MVGQYAKDTSQTSTWDWGTYIAATSYSGGCDSDNDGWTDAVEAIIGTNPALACGTNAWPVDSNSDTLITSADLSEVASVIGQAVPPASARMDTDPPDQPDQAITSGDLSQVAALIGQGC